MLLSGNEYAQQRLASVAQPLTRLFDGWPRGMTAISSHALAGHAAVQYGFSRVINLVVDCHPQHFNAVPGCTNATQGDGITKAYEEMGYSMVSVGCWVGKELADSLPESTAQRLRRLDDPREARRLLITIGGAGAQAGLVISLLHELRTRMLDGTWQVVVNIGDHTYVA